MKAATRIAIALVLVLVAAAPAPAQTMRVGVTAKVLDYLPVFLGQDKGMFREQGITPEILVLGTSTRIFPALVGGSVDVFDSTLFVVFLGIEKGEKVQVIGAATHYAPFNLVTRPEIKTVQDMKGKRVGSTGVGSGHYFSLTEYMERRGLRFPGDYTFITIGGTPETWRALQAGTVDAGVLLFPFHVLARREGFNVLAELYREVPEYPLTGLAVRAEWARKNEDTLVRYLAGLRRAVEYTYTHPREAQEVAVRLFGIPPDLARLGWEEYRKIGQWQRDLTISEGAVRTMLGFLVKSGDLKIAGEPSKYVDLEYVRKAARVGW